VALHQARGPAVARTAAPRAIGRRQGPTNLDGVFRLWDDRTDSCVELATRMSIPLRVCVHGPSAGTRYGLAGLRILLVADVLTRIAELRGLQVITIASAASLPPGTLEHGASALGIHPPVACAGPEEAAAVLGGPADVHVAGTTASLGDRENAVLIAVGPVDDQLPDLAGGHGGDLLPLRLALLSSPHRQPVELAQATLADGDETVNRWRYKVAEWADQPSRPIPADIAAKLAVAFDDDLNTVAVLEILRSVESDHGTPAGAKFETFAFADRVLGLELVREIGQRRQ
jgi:hypothetical protein